MAATKFIFRKAGEAGYVEQAPASVELQTVTVTTALTVPQTPTEGVHAASKAYVDAKAAEVRGLANASSDQVAYSLDNLRKYVDENIQGLDVKASVRAVKTDGALSPLTGRTAGLTVDGVALNVGDRVLLVAQGGSKSVAHAQNGIYVVTLNGSAWDLVRSADASGAASQTFGSDNVQLSDMSVGLFTFAEEGTDNVASGWVLAEASATPIVVGTTTLKFSQFSGAGQLTAGAGLTKTGNTFDIGAGDGITVNNDSIQVRLAASEALGINGSSELEVVLASSSVLSKASGLDVVIETSSGLQKSAGKLDAALAAGAVLSKASGLDVVVTASSGLQKESGELDVALRASGVISKSAGLDLDIAASSGLQKSAGALDVALKSGSVIAKSAGLDVVVTSSSGLQKAAGELDVALRASGVISKASGLDVDIASGLMKASGSLDLKIDADAPFTKASGIKLELDSDPGLKIAANKLSAKIDSDGGLQSVADGLAVKIASADELSAAAGGLSIVGVPALFKIAGTATSTNLTAANANKLVDDGDAKDLHGHSVDVMDLTDAPASCENCAIAVGASAFAKASIQGANADAHKTVGIAISSDGNNARLVRGGRIVNFFGSAPGNGPVYINEGGGIVTYANLTLGSGSYRLVRAGIAKGQDLFVSIMDLGEVSV